MKPILYESTETLFQSNGLGVLSDCISAHVLEERNGQYEAEFEYPVDGIHYSDILEGRIILISHDESGDLQPFDIYGHSKTINGVTTFYAHHIAYRQNGITVKPFTASSLSQALTKIKSNSINSNPFNYSTDKSVSASFQLANPKPLRSILGGEEGSLLDVFGTGEYEWDRFQVILHLHRGTDSGVVVRYGKNLISLQDDIDYSDSYNGIVPFWFGQNEPADGEEAVETLVTLSEWVVYKSGSTYDGRNTIIPVDFSSQFQTVPTEAQLRSAAQSYLAKGNPLLPTDTLTFDFVELSQTEEYSYLALQQVNLCDTVTVVYDDIDTAMKVISVDWDVLNERYRSLTLGDAPATYAQVITDRLATIAENANESAKLAKLWATNALSIAGNTDQYFWFTGTGTDTGAHITETPKETFLADPTHGGGNLIARSNGIAVRDGLTELATFGANGSQIGLSNSGHVTIESGGMEVFDGSNSLASFGTTARIGKDNSSRFLMNASSLQAYDSSNVKYFEVSANGISYGSSIVASTDDVEQAIDDIEVGGRNLLLKSGVEKSNSAYGMADYYFPEGSEPVEGETYTISLKGTLGSGKTQFGIYNSGGYVDECILTSAYLKNGIYTRTFTWKITSGSTTASNTYLRVYQMPQSVTATSTIEWIKLEKGDKATDWTPAPEDVDADIDDARKTATSYLTTISGTSGISVHDANDTSNYVNINSSAVDVVQNSVKVASFGASTEIGAKATGGNITIDADNGFRIWNSGRSATFAQITSTTARIGLSASAHTNITASGMEVFKKESGDSSPVSVASFGSTVRVGATANDQSRTEISSSGIDFISQNSSGTDVNLAHIGYGTTYSLGVEGTDSYFTFGARGSGIIGAKSVCMGDNNVAGGLYGVALGSSNTVMGSFGIALGSNNEAKAYKSNTLGVGLRAYGSTQTVLGAYNVADGDGSSALDRKGNYVLIVGNGTGGSSSARSNALTVDWSGNLVASGTIKGSGWDGNLVASGTIKGSGWDGNLVLPTGYYLMSNTDKIVCGINSSNQYLYGYGSYNSSEGASYYDGNSVNIRSKGSVNITAPSKVLVTGSILLSAGNTYDARTNKSSSTTGGWANERFRFMNADGDTAIGRLGMLGSQDTITYMYLGMNAYNGNNLRVYDDGHIWANGIVNNGTYDALYKVVDVTVSVASGSAGSSVSSANHAISVPTGYTAVGIVGISVGSFAILPCNYYVSGTNVRSGFYRLQATSQAYNVVFKVLCLKATSA